MKGKRQRCALMRVCKTKRLHKEWRKKTVKKNAHRPHKRAFPMMSHCINTRLNAGIMWLRTSVSLNSKCRVAAENTEPFSWDDSNLLVLAEELKSRRNTGSYLCRSEPSRCVRPARCSVALPTCEQILKNVTTERELCVLCSSLILF